MQELKSKEGAVGKWQIFGNIDCEGLVFTIYIACKLHAPAAPFIPFSVFAEKSI
jgi:hypothetical protein